MRATTTTLALLVALAFGCQTANTRNDRIVEGTTFLATGAGLEGAGLAVDLVSVPAVISPTDRNNGYIGIAVGAVLLLTGVYEFYIGGKELKDALDSAPPASDAPATPPTTTTTP